MSEIRSFTLLSGILFLQFMSGCTSLIQNLPELPPEPEAKITPPDSELASELEIVVLHKANFNPLDQDHGTSYEVINSVEKYQSRLQLHTIETPKPIDFGQSQILVSSAGEKPTGGYKVSTTSLEEYSDRIVATIVQVIPGPDCVTTPSITHPFEFVHIPSVKPVIISQRQEVEDC